ncbi:MAG: hypothetical protein NXI30_17775 [bacterium]|nr:hypothetical protein [bacterium]
MISRDDPKFDCREDFITSDSVDSFVLEKSPDFLDYLFFHNVLDKFCFALKAHYSDRETVKKRRYRLDLVFQNYLLENQVKLSKRKGGKASREQVERIEFFLTKAWHNELVRGDPLLPDYLRIGVQLSGFSGPGSGGIAAWNIVQSYYAVFEFVGVLAAVHASDLKVDGHKKLARNFNSQLAGLSKTVLFYPFTLNSKSDLTKLPQHPKHTTFHYASYPREAGTLVSDLDNQIVKAFQLLDRTRRTSFLDFLYEFRLWANYTGVRSLLRLADGGYVGFLMKNLATIVFFAGGIAEISAIQQIGQAQYLRILRSFQEDYIDQNERFAANRYLIPAYIRLRSYKHLGLISNSISFVRADIEDPVQFVER